MREREANYREVEFWSEGAVLRGRLYMPSVSPPYAAVVMAHGFTATISMTADRYAEVLREAGFAVLLYDHRNFGASDGEPRRALNAWLQARGYRDALTYLENLDEVDSSRLALWGDSLSAGVAVVAAAVDRRPRAIVVQAPSLGAERPPADPDGKRFGRIEQTLLHGDIDGKPAPSLPVVSFDPLYPSALRPLTAYRWFIEYGGRLGSNWLNDVSRVAVETPEPWNAALCMAHLTMPLLMIYSPRDEMSGSNPVVARAAFDTAKGPKQLVEIDGGHFGLLYYPGELFDIAGRAQAEFLQQYL